MLLNATMDRRNEVAKVLQSRQYAALTDPILAHDIGLFYFWWAKALERKGLYCAADEAWHRVIANWALVLEDDVFWKDWCRSKSELYGVDIPQNDVKAMRGRLIEKFQDVLTNCSGSRNSRGQGHQTSKSVPLDLIFELEIRALRALKGAGGFPAPSNEHKKIVCGPLMIQQLGLSPVFSWFIASLQSIDEKASDMITRLLRSVDGKLDKSFLDTKSDRKLMQYFSHLGISCVYLDRSQPEQALAMLDTRCRHWADLVGESAKDSEEYSKQLPFVCRQSCPRFGECNPAYVAMDNGDQLLFEHAVELAVEAHLRKAEMQIAAGQMEVQHACAEWQEAVTLAEKIDKNQETRYTIIETIIGRTVALEKRRKFEKAIGLLDEALKWYQDDRLQGKLAKLLHAQGISAREERRSKDAVSILRQAYRLNPYAPHICCNLVLALEHYAGDCLAGRDYDRARELLLEARHILVKEILQEPHGQRLREQLTRVQTHLVLVNKADGKVLLGPDCCFVTWVS